jgi:hypothetical protein
MEALLLPCPTTSCTLPLHARSSKIQPSTFKNGLHSPQRSNYADAAKKWNIDRSTLSRRHRGITGSKKDHYSYTLKALTDVQEDVLVRYINDLSARGLPPIPQIVKNLAIELAGKDIG